MQLYNEGTESFLIVEDGELVPFTGGMLSEENYSKSQWKLAEFTTASGKKSYSLENVFYSGKFLRMSSDNTSLGLGSSGTSNRYKWSFHHKSSESTPTILWVQRNRWNPGRVR